MPVRAWVVSICSRFRSSRCLTSTASTSRLKKGSTSRAKAVSPSHSTYWYSAQAPYWAYSLVRSSVAVTRKAPSSPALSHRERSASRKVARSHDHLPSSACNGVDRGISRENSHPRD